MSSHVDVSKKMKKICIYNIYIYLSLIIDWYGNIKDSRIVYQPSFDIARKHTPTNTLKPQTSKMTTSIFRCRTKDTKAFGINWKVGHLPKPSLELRVLITPPQWQLAKTRREFLPRLLWPFSEGNKKQNKTFKN